MCLQFLNKCDKVAFMSEGKVIEYGTHGELVKNGGAYANMVAFDQTQKAVIHHDDEDDKEKPELKRLRSMSEKSTREEVQTFIKEEGTLIINSAYMFVFKKNI